MANASKPWPQDLLARARDLMNSTSVKTSRNLWPHAIIVWFVIFASALAAWISYAVRQDMDLVRPDYYEEEIRFQKQLDRLNRTAAVRNQIALGYNAARGEVTLRLPLAHLDPRPGGRVHFYRPANAALDADFPLAVDAAGLQRIDVRSLRSGHWKVRVQWNASGQDYSFEETLVLDEARHDDATTAAGAR
jgi:hypothetical protein